ncbi:MAG: hypothetical protein ACI4MZ_05950 [Christensenellales bacterium]
MKIRMFFGAVKTTILALISLGALAIVGLDIAMLAGANGVYTDSPAIAIVSLVAATLIAVASLLVLFNSTYNFKDDRIVATLGFFVDKIKYDEILCVKQNSETREIFLITKGLKESDGDVSFRINVSTKNVDDFIKRLREHIGDVIVEVFTPDKKDKKKK